MNNEKHRAYDYSWLRQLPVDALLCKRDLKGIYCIKTKYDVSSRNKFPKADIVIRSTITGRLKSFWKCSTILNEIARQESMLYVA